MHLNSRFNATQLSVDMKNLVFGVVIFGYIQFGNDLMLAARWL